MTDIDRFHDEGSQHPPENSSRPAGVSVQTVHTPKKRDTGTPEDVDEENPGTSVFLLALVAVIMLVPGLLLFLAGLMQML